jgi:hypothetical protein
MKKSILLLLWGMLATNILCMTGYNSSNDVDASDIYFPVTKEAFVDYPNALTYGTLIFDGKYLLIKGISPTSGADYLPVWPYGYSINVKGNEIQVLDGNGQVVACTGDSIKVGGGETPEMWSRGII